MGNISRPHPSASATAASTHRKQASIIRSHLTKTYALPSISLAIRRSKARKAKSSSSRVRSDSLLSNSQPLPTNNKPFRLMDLPIELRLQIFGHALKRDGRMYLDSLKAPALAAVSKQVRDESLPVFLSSNSFTTFLSRQPSNTYETLFLPQTIFWLSRIPATTPLIKDLTFALQPSEWSQDDFLVEDFRITVQHNTPVITHGRDCPFCQNGTYGTHIQPISLSHPALSPHFRNILSAAQQQHDQHLASAARLFYPGGAKGLSLCDVTGLADMFSGPSEAITAEQTYYGHLVEWLQEEMGMWDEEEEPLRKEREIAMNRVADEVLAA